MFFRACVLIRSETMPKGGQSDDVDFGMTEEPEQVLEKQRAATAIFAELAHLDQRRHEEAGSQQTVEQQHHRANEQRRECQQRHNGGGEDAPHRQGQTHQGHAAGARLQHGHHVIQPAHGEADDEQDQGGQHEHDAPFLSGRAGENRLRRVQRPAGAGGAAGHEEGRSQHQDREQVDPVTQHVHIGEDHVPCSDHQRDQVVAEASEEQCGKQIDHHDHAVHGDELEVLVGIDEGEGAGKSQLQSHQPRQHQGHETDGRGCKRVLDGDDLGVLRKDVLRPPAFRMVELDFRHFGRRNACDPIIWNIDHRAPPRSFPSGAMSWFTRPIHVRSGISLFAARLVRRPHDGLWAG
ncbi:hypothetical protein ACVWW3_001582 [Bradyrhizobium sp. LM2.9]